MVVFVQFAVAVLISRSVRAEVAQGKRNGDMAELMIGVVFVVIALYAYYLIVMTILDVIGLIISRFK